jgi:hypothetical protein
LSSVDRLSAGTVRWAHLQDLDRAEVSPRQRAKAARNLIIAAAVASGVRR